MAKRKIFGILIILIGLIILFIKPILLFVVDKKVDNTVDKFNNVNIEEITKNNEVEGSDAYETKRDSFIRIQVENFRALFIGRGKGGKKGYYTIWPEGAARHWLENENNNSDDAENGDNEE